MKTYTPILLLASERTGTNLLRAILSSHSKVASPPPCGLIGALAKRQFFYLCPLNPLHVKELIDDAITITQIHLNPWDIELNSQYVFDRMTEMTFWQLFKIINDLYTEKQKCSFWFSKEPDLFEHIYEVKMCMPNAKFIYMVRDGRDVAASMLKGGVHENHIYNAAHRWAKNQRYCLNAISDPNINNDIFILKYENLITEPESVIRNIMSFLGLDFELSQLEFHRKDEVINHAHSSEFWKNISKPINSSNKGNYKKQLTARQVAIFESIAWDEMRALDYDLETQIRKEFSIFQKGIFKLSAILRNKLKNFSRQEEAKQQRDRVKRFKEVMNRSFDK